MLADPGHRPEPVPTSVGLCGPRRVHVAVPPSGGGTMMMCAKRRKRRGNSNKGDGMWAYLTVALILALLMWWMLHESGHHVLR